MLTGMLAVALARDSLALPPSNDQCANMLQAFDGDVPFSTVEATTDGPSHLACLFFQDDQVNQDIWFRYQATAASRTFSLCGSSFDTKIAVYVGTDCPPSDENLLACNDDSCNLQSQISVPLIINQCYTIRVGGFAGGVGKGTLNIGGPVGDCFGEGPCCEPHVGYGCQSNTCCLMVCDMDPACCDGFWDDLCVQLATEYCLNGCGNGDANDNAVVDVDDLLMVINNWGDCPCLKCPGDVSNDSEVDVDDLLQVINAWSV
jgi:hypothetical protein